jgi:hypothetical protein
MIGATMACDVAQALQDCLAGLDWPVVERSFHAQHEMVYLDKVLPTSLVDALVAEAAALKPWVARSVALWHRQGGSVSFYHLKRHAPLMLELYRSERMLDLVSRLAGKRLFRCHEQDPHSCALFLYTKKGDRVDMHYDGCFYPEGRIYTVLMPLVNRSRSPLVCDLYTKLQGRAVERVELDTAPGSLVIFKGGNVWHGVPPIGAGEERIVFSLEFLTDPSMSRARRLVANTDHAMKYFGFKSILQHR